MGAERIVLEGGHTVIAATTYNPEARSRTTVFTVVANRILPLMDAATAFEVPKFQLIMLPQSSFWL